MALFRSVVNKYVGVPSTNVEKFALAPTCTLRAPNRLTSISLNQQKINIIDIDRSIASIAIDSSGKIIGNLFRWIDGHIK